VVKEGAAHALLLSQRTWKKKGPSVSSSRPKKEKKMFALESSPVAGKSRRAFNVFEPLGSSGKERLDNKPNAQREKRKEKKTFGCT